MKDIRGILSKLTRSPEYCRSTIISTTMPTSRWNRSSSPPPLPPPPLQPKQFLYRLQKTFNNRTLSRKSLLRLASRLRIPSSSRARWMLKERTKLQKLPWTKTRKIRPARIMRRRRVSKVKEPEVCLAMGNYPRMIRLKDCLWNDTDRNTRRMRRVVVVWINEDYR